MQIDRFLGDHVSRRRFFAGAGVSGSAVFLAACGSTSDRGTADVPAQNAETAAADSAILNSALDLEHMAVAAYTAATKILRGDALAVGRTFLAHEKEHVGALARAIREMHGIPNRPSADYGFQSLGSQTEALRFVSAVENTSLTAYVDALPKLTAPALRGTAASILTNQAQHIAVLDGILGRPQAASAFVVGKA